MALRTLALVMAIGCGADPKDSAPDCAVADPQLERIDVPAGYRTLDAPVDAPWLEAPRTVPVGVWYNTEDSSGEEALYIESFKDEMSYVDAAFADPAPGCKLPLVVYSHGSQGWGGNSSPLLRHLVAQGWVAAAPDHVGNTLIDDEDPRPVSYSLTRVADMVATIDALEDLPAEDPLYGRVDTSRVLVLGHSYGGQTAWLLAGPSFDTARVAERCDASELGCSEAELAAFAAPVYDERVVGVLPMDGYADTDLVAAEGWATAALPILYLSRAEDDYALAYTTAAAADVTWAAFEGACHETFTGTPLSCEGFEKEDGLDVVAQYLTSFAATRVLGLEGEPYASILDGSAVVDARVAVQRSRE